MRCFPRPMRADGSIAPSPSRWRRNHTFPSATEVIARRARIAILIAGGSVGGTAMRVFAFGTVVITTVVLAAGCSSSPETSVGTQMQAVQGGSVDTTHNFA